MSNSDKRYGVKSVFRTVQGEGCWSGTAAVFVRFTGCNAWDGNPLNRDAGVAACASWCDTDFRKGEVLSADNIVALVGAAWEPHRPRRPTERRLVVLTGGEPLLQVDAVLVGMLQSAGYFVACETNGSKATPAAHEAMRVLDWVTVSPKLGLAVPDGVFAQANEVKVVLPGGGHRYPEGWTLDLLENVERLAGPATPLWVMPQDMLVASNLVEETALVRTGRVQRDNLPLEEQTEDRYQQNVKRCLDFVAEHPRWRVGLQAHKYLRVP